MLTVRTVPVLAALAFCGPFSAAAQAQFGMVPGQGVRFSTVATGTQSQMAGAGLYQFYDQATLQNHWQRFGLRGQFPPKINWTTDQVIVIHLGQRNTGGFAVQLGALQKQANNRVRITAVESTPLKGQVTTQALTSPFIAVAIERTIPGFDLVWTKRAGNGLMPDNLPPGSTVYSYPGNVTIVNPRIGVCDFWGGDYYSNCSAPAEIWIESDADLYRYSQQYLGNPRALPSGFDWRTERLLAVHLGTRRTAVAIEAVNFKREGDRGVVVLAEGAVPPKVRRGAPISPYALIRVSREVKSIEVNWAKKDK